MVKTNLEELIYVKEMAGVLASFKASLRTTTWEELGRYAGNRDRMALVIVDMVNGFCREGALASPRIAALIPTIVRLVREYRSTGAQYLLLVNDAHSEGAAEFGAFPPHCLAGTSESEVVDELKPYLQGSFVFAKNATTAVFGARGRRYPDGEELDFLTFVRSLLAGGKVNLFVVAGNCTDLCILQCALALKLLGNSLNLPVKVVVPEDAVTTYDLPVDVARPAGLLPHPAEPNHLWALYHMALNDISVVKSLVDNQV
ncbi:MAG: Isochorismatase hydrolase [Clostridia bacterium 62_21]|nr:MAG: Isochorismatase hydrolase [Clostridia bacterium 62_21]HAG07714.1 nicotinamidase [Peptococcaceae bacterium]